MDSVEMCWKCLLSMWNRRRTQPVNDSFPYLVSVIWVCKGLYSSPLLLEDLVRRDDEQFIVSVKELLLQIETDKKKVVFLPFI